MNLYLPQYNGGEIPFRDSAYAITWQFFSI